LNKRIYCCSGAGVTTNQFVRAVEAIYEAAAHPSCWPDALQAIADVLDGVGTVLLWRRDDGRYGTIVSPTLLEAQEDFQKNWWQHDIRSIRGLEQRYVRREEAFTDRHLVSQEEIEQHPIYTQFLARHGLKWCAAASISPDPLIDVWLSVQRAKDKNAFSDDELAVLQRLARHAENSLRLSSRLFDAELSRQGLSEALSRVNMAVAAVDSLKRVVFSNAAADALLGDGLQILNARLRVANSHVQALLDAAIDRMIAAAPGDFLDVAKPILVQREKRDRPIVLYVLPITERGPLDIESDFLMHARAIVLGVDPSAGAQADPTVVRDLLGLTLGEARVAALVGAGLTPAAAAQKLGIAEGTARVVLKRVFSKAGVSRQSELATLLTRLALR